VRATDSTIVLQTLVENNNYIYEHSSVSSVFSQITGNCVERQPFRWNEGWNEVETWIDWIATSGEIVFGTLL